MSQLFDVVVIGARQAGLAAGWHLQRRGASFVILEAAPEVGHSWRTRWDSLRLFTSARYDALPGLPFPGDPDHHPDKDEVADYLRDYAAAMDAMWKDPAVQALAADDAGRIFALRFALEQMSQDCRDLVNRINDLAGRKAAT